MNYKELQKVLEYGESHMFLHGAGGSGKSTLIQWFLTETNKGKKDSPERVFPDSHLSFPLLVNGYRHNECHRLTCR